MTESRLARSYLIAVPVVGLLFLAILVWNDRALLSDVGSGDRLGEVQLLGFLIGFALVASISPIVTTSGLTLSVGLAPLFAAVLVLHPGLAAIVGLLGSMDTRVPGRDIPWNRFFFNRGMSALMYGAGGLVFHGLSSPAGPGAQTGFSGYNLVAAGAVALVVVGVLNAPLVIVGASLMTGESVRIIAYRTLRGVALSYAGLAPLGALIAYLVQPRRPEGLLVAGLILILLLVYRELSRRSFKLETVARGSYVAQSRLIDKKDRSTFGHSERVGNLAEATANKMGLSTDLVEQIKIGATLHDLGKIAIPDAILHKPGKLTDEEWEIMKSHAAEGYEVLTEQEVLIPAANIVRSHHENFDGSGYPDGLAGRAIPVGGRITRVVDSYDCMTNVRDYREWVKGPFEALSEVHSLAGKWYDQGVVEAFTEVLVEQHPEMVAQLSGTIRTPKTHLTDALAYRPFLKLWIAHGLSVFGDMFTVTALALAAYQTANSIWAVSAIFGARALPNLLFGLFAGYLVDRYDRKFLMMLMDVARAVLVVSLPFLLTAPLVLLLLIAFLISTATVLFNPARAAALPDIVPADLLRSSNSALTLLERIGEVGGYLAAAAILPLGGVQVAFAIDAVTFIVSAALLLSTRFPEMIMEGNMLGGLKRVREDIVVGLSQIGRIPLLRVAMPLSLLMAAAGAALFPLMVPLALGHLNAGQSGFPILEAGIAIGVAAGALTLGYLRTERRGPLIIAGGLGMGVATALAGISTDFRLTLVFFVAGGFANAFYLIPLVTAIQEASDSDIRGRVFAARFTLAQVGVLIGTLYAGVVASLLPATSVGLVVASTGVLMILVSTGAALSPALRKT